jgi:secreted trypsin-like serine protease
MKFATLFRASAVASALAATQAQGYTFSETSGLLTDSAAEEASTGLTTNEEDRIYGGSEADASQFPYIVSLREDDADSNTYCGGTLIASQYVVTAAHCVKTDEATIYASIGSAFGSGSSADGQVVKVIEGFRHPMYNKSEHLYDVGVLKLETEVSTDTIDLCASDGSDNEVGTVATVRGWGLTENGSQSLMMEEVNVQIVSNAECNKEYSDRITDGMLCAGDGNGKDSCNGDSGGPLIENDVLVGIVSWGGKCGVNSGVYTRVSYVLDYINDIVNGGTGSSFTESAAGSVDQGQEETEAPSTETPATTVPVTKAPTAAPTTQAPTVAPTSAPTPAPTTELPATEVPETESPSASQGDQYAPSTDSAEQDETQNSTESANQSEPAATDAPTPASTSSSTPASDSMTKTGKECATQF